MVLPSGEVRRFGTAEPEFHVTLHTDELLRRKLDEFSFGKAYVKGEFDIEGDIVSALGLRKHLKKGADLFTLLKFLYQLFIRSARHVNKRAISKHYNFGDDFYLKFLDSKYRFYSQCLFRSDDDTLEQAAERKLESMYEALRLKPGMRLLDIGAGWGGIHEYCGPRGVHVTSLTLAEDSHRYVTELIERLELRECSVRIEDFLDHAPEAPYDAVVIYGVIEHIPYYRRFCRRLWECLKPGGLFYLDASAAPEKYAVSDFTRNYIWPGTHSFLCLQEFIQEQLYHGMAIIDVTRETKEYELTMKHWALRFDDKKDEIIEQWGEAVYRAFRLYLWAGSYAFRENALQAYHLVSQRTPRPGPRPGAVKRTYGFLRNLV